MIRRRRFTICLIPWLLIVITSALGRGDELSPTAAEFEFFEKRVRPLLVEHCYSCHSTQSEKLKAGLRVDSRASLLKGGDSGEAITPKDADGSLLIEAVRYESYEMPPKGMLPAHDIETLARWVNMGAPWPAELGPAELGVTPVESESEFDLQSRKAEHWVWQPIRAPEVPEVQRRTWPRSELDYFVLAKLEEAKLAPAADADKSALLRRLYFDLIGLPPTSAQVAKFLADTSPGATERLVDELLASPHFGERWGRHWLDLVRYAESRGHEFDEDAPNAYQYRDYVIRALNADVPHDDLVREHIAGDLLESPRIHPETGFNESILGTGFWFLGEWVHSPVDIRKEEADRFDNMIDVMSKAFLGVTVACARCHDHKFDAISTADYYSLSGFLQSSDYRQVRFESQEHNRRIADELAALDDTYQAAITAALAKSGLNLTAEKPMADSVAATMAVDYEATVQDLLIQDGFLFGQRPRPAGAAYLATVDNEPTLRFARRTAAVSDPFWSGLESVHEKGMHRKDRLFKMPRSGRTLHTPSFTLTSGDVACRVRGSGHVFACVDSHRLIAGPLHGETIKPIKPDDAWVELNLNRYLGHRLHLEFTPTEDAQLEVLLITQGAPPEIRQQLREREARVAASVAKFAKSAERLPTHDLDKLVRAWADQRSKLQAQVMRRSRLAMAMMDGTGEEDHVLIRGNSSKPGPQEPRHFLTAITGDQPLPIRSGSGRLELARQINDPTNPLTTRVMVNRIWHFLIGRGIVPTTDDFGWLGQRPSHPDLLDHLATQFMADGRSIKRMIRTIALSRTYQLSSHADRSAVASDPKNILWHHRAPKRLEGEAIHDALLALSGRLDATQFGEPVPIHLTSFMQGRGRPSLSGPLDGAGRRSIYTAVRRNFLSPFMLAFDTPVPFSTMGRRNVSNVPAQALILMNDPFVVEQARAWAQRTLEQNLSAESRIISMYRTAFARRPTDQEQSIAVEFVTTESTARAVSKSDIDVWADFAHALINTKEFIFLR